MITYRGVSLQADGVYFDLWAGLHESPPVRGEDVTIPGAPGTTWMPKVYDARELELRGYILGAGASEAERQEDFRNASYEVITGLFDFAAEPDELTVSPPYLGLTEALTIGAVAVDVIGGPVQACMTFQRWTVRLVAHSPVWAPAGS